MYQETLLYKEIVVSQFVGRKRVLDIMDKGKIYRQNRSTAEINPSARNHSDNLGSSRTFSFKFGLYYTPKARRHVSIN